jgi:hypothetical protein
LLSNTPDAVIQFFINDVQIAERTSDPYCLQLGLNGTCDNYDFLANGYEPGQYTLKVIGITADQEPIEQTRTFTLSNTPEAQPTPTPNQNNLDITIEGVSDTETISGIRTIKATIAGGTNVKVDFYINDRLYASDTSEPYCMVDGSGSECGGLNTNSLANGSYIFNIVASSSNANTATKTVRLAVDNKPPSAPASSAPTSTPNVVVGVTNQQANGTVRATVPSSRTANASSVTYSVNDTPVATVPVTNPSTTIDTSKYSNGNAKISATINKKNGEKEILQSNVKVNNNGAASLARWMKDNFLITVFLVLIFSVGAFFLVRFIVAKIRARKMEQMHNLAGTYSYVQPQEQTYQYQAAGGLAALVVVSVSALTFMQYGANALSTNFGFIAEVESGIRPSQYSTSEENGSVFVRFNHSQNVPNPNPNPNPTPSNANILNETFDGRGQGVSNGTLINGSNSYARLNYQGIPVAGFCIYDQSPCYSTADNRMLPAFDSSVKVSGEYSARFSIASVGRPTQAGSFYHQSFDRTTSAYARFWWRFDDAMANAGGNPSLIHWRGDYGQGPQYANIRFGANRTLNLYNHLDSNGVEGTYQYSANTWYDVSLELQGPSGLSRVIVRDQQGNQLQDTTHYYQSGGDIGFIEFGVLGGYSQNYSSLASMWFDDVRISTQPINGGTITQEPTPNPAPNPTPNPNPNPNPAPSGSSFSTNFDNCNSITECGFYVLPGNGPHDFSYPGPDGSALGPISVYGGRAHAEGTQREGVAATNINVGNDQFAEATVYVGPAWNGNFFDYTGVTVRTSYNSSTGHYQWYKMEIYQGNARIVSLFYDPSRGHHWYRDCANYGGIFTNSSHRLRLEIRGQTLTGYINGSQVLQCTDESANAVRSGGTPGIHMQGTNLSLDDYSAGGL